MNMYNVLVCDDDKAILDSIEIYLRNEGYNVFRATNGIEALEIAEREELHCIVLDIMMPKMDGMTTTMKLRDKKNIPRILLSAKSEDTDKIAGLSFGADDYVTKPFSTSELMARVDVLYRRVEMSAGLADNSHANVITSGEFELNMRNRTLTKNGVPIELTQVEFQIMEYFFTNQDAALSRTDILEKVWGSDYFGEEKIVDVNIRRLRMKVEDDPSAPKHLLTMWGVGYKWIA